MAKKSKATKIEPKEDIQGPARISRDINADEKTIKMALKTLKLALKDLEPGTPQYKRVYERINLLENKL